MPGVSYPLFGLPAGHPLGEALAHHYGDGHAGELGACGDQVCGKLLAAYDDYWLTAAARAAVKGRDLGNPA